MYANNLRRTLGASKVLCVPGFPLPMFLVGHASITSPFGQIYTRLHLRAVTHQGMLCSAVGLGAPTTTSCCQFAARRHPQHRLLRISITPASLPAQSTAQPLASSIAEMPALHPNLLTSSIVVGLSLVVSAAMLKAWRIQHTPLLHGITSPFMQEALGRCPTAHAAYSVNPLLANRHVETILASQLRREPGVRYIREMLRMQDGGTVTVDTEDSPEAHVCKWQLLLLLL